MNPRKPFLCKQMSDWGKLGLALECANVEVRFGGEALVCARQSRTAPPAEAAFDAWR
jgi:hypothetical protein